MQTYDYIIFGVGFLLSVYLGWKAREIFSEIPKEDWIKRPKSWRLHQFWFNFIGSFVGWLILLGLFIYFRGSGMKEIGFYHFIFLFIGVMGVVGWLPMGLMGLVARLVEFGREALERLMKLISRN